MKKQFDYSIFDKIKYYEWKAINLRSDLKKIEAKLEKLRHDALVVPPKGAEDNKINTG